MELKQRKTNLLRKSFLHFVNIARKTSPKLVPTSPLKIFGVQTFLPPSLNLENFISPPPLIRKVRTNHSPPLQGGGDEVMRCHKGMYEKQYTQEQVLLEKNIKNKTGFVWYN